MAFDVAGFEHWPKTPKRALVQKQKLSLNDGRDRTRLQERAFCFAAVAIAVGTLLIPVSIGMVIEVLHHMPVG